MAKKYFIEQDKKVGSEKYSQRISKLRIEKQITLDELQEKTGIPKTTISSWIKGDFTPNIKGITAIAKLHSCFHCGMTTITNTIAVLYIIFSVRIIGTSTLSKH